MSIKPLNVEEEERKEVQTVLNEYFQDPLLEEIERNTRGFLNVCWKVKLKKGNFFLRRYRVGIKKDRIVFEHSLIQHLNKKNFTKIPKLLQTLNNKTFVERFIGQRKLFYALFEYAEGEDRYVWDRPNCSDVELKNAAKTLAEYHAFIYDFKPKYKEGPLINKLILQYRRKIMKLKPRRKSMFETLLFNHKDKILKEINLVYELLKKSSYNTLPRIVIHGDFHLGNMKFINNEVTALFDFDWARIEARAYDVAMALLYNCSKWEEQKSPIDLHKLTLFLDAYEEELKNLKMSWWRLSGKEVTLIPILIRAANLYLIDWACDDFYNKKVNDEEYYRYLKHNLNIIEWFNE